MNQLVLSAATLPMTPLSTNPRQHHFQTDALLRIRQQVCVYMTQLVVLCAESAVHILAMLATVVSQELDRLGRAVFYSLCSWLLNPNAVAMALLWPGWWVLGGAYVAAALYG